MSKRKLSESKYEPYQKSKKLKRLNSGSFGDVFSDGLTTAYKISHYNLDTSSGINSEILNEIVFLKKFKGSSYLLSLKSLQIIENLSQIKLRILVPLAISDLKTFIREKTLIERGKYWDILNSNLLNALDYLERNQICHLDIKPGNILFFGDHFKLNDFNLTISTSNLRPGISHPAMTVLYRSPEVILNNDYNEIFQKWQIEVKSDIWSLGCTLYEYLTGQYLFDVHNNTQLLKLLYFRATELQHEREPYQKYQFLRNLNQQIYQSLPLIGLESYLQKAYISKYQQWYQVICSMLNLDPFQRPTPEKILEEFKLGLLRNPKKINNWDDFDYLKHFQEQVSLQEEHGFFEKMRFMTKLKYDYQNSYDRLCLWKQLWSDYRKKDHYSLEIFLEIFEVTNRYLRTLMVNPFRSYSEYWFLFEVVDRLVNKLRRPEISDQIYCFPKRKANQVELDIIRNLESDFSITPVPKIDLDELFEN